MSMQLPWYFYVLCAILGNMYARLTRQWNPFVRFGGLVLIVVLLCCLEKGIL